MPKVKSKSVKKSPPKKSAPKKSAKVVKKASPKATKKVVKKAKPPKAVDPYEKCVAFVYGTSTDIKYVGFPRNTLGLIPYPFEKTEQGVEISSFEVNAVFIFDEKGRGYGYWPSMGVFLKQVKSKNPPEPIGKYRIQQVKLEAIEGRGKYLNGGLTVQ